MAGRLGLHTFSYENGGMRVWRAYDVGPGKFYSEAQLLRFGTHQGPTDLVIMKPFSKPIIEAGTYQQHISRQEPSLSMGHHKNNHTRHIQMKKARSFPVQRKNVLRRSSHSPLSKGTWMSLSTCLRVIFSKNRESEDTHEKSIFLLFRQNIP